MLNAHTLTRTFREIKYDIRVFLETLYSVFNADSNVLVESRWADGSLDVTPTKILVDAVVNSVFPSISIGDCVLKPGEGYTTYLSISNRRLRARFDVIGDFNTNLVFDECSIHEIVAKTIEIEDPSINLYLDKVNKVNTNSLQVFKELKCNDLKYNSITVSNTLDISHVVTPIKISMIDTYPGSSQLLSYCSGYATDTKKTIVLTGPLCLADNSPAGTTLRNTYSERFKNYPRGYVKVPLLNGSGYATTEAMSFVSSGMDTQIPPESYLGMLCIYPKIRGGYTFNTESYYWMDSYSFVMERLDPEDNLKVITVHNKSDVEVKACNVWYIQTVSEASTPTITAGNYVILPPHSQIDFLLLHSEYLETQTRVVEMRPMKNINA